MPANRRQFLAGLGAVAAAPVLLAVTATSADASAAPGNAATPGKAAPKAECMADLIESGAVTRADLMAR